MDSTNGFQLFQDGFALGRRDLALTHQGYKRWFPRTMGLHQTAFQSTVWKGNGCGKNQTSSGKPQDGSKRACGPVCSQNEHKFQPTSGYYSSGRNRQPSGLDSRQNQCSHRRYSQKRYQIYSSPIPQVFFHRLTSKGYHATCCIKRSRYIL